MGYLRGLPASVAQRRERNLWYHHDGVCPHHASSHLSRLALGLITRRMPLWGFFAGVGVGIVASITIFTLERQGVSLPWHEKMFYMSAASLLPPLFSTFFWKYSSPKFRHHVDEFFKLIKRPVVVGDEVKTDR